MKENIINYFTDLNYNISNKHINSLVFKHHSSGLELTINFLSTLKENLSEYEYNPDRKYLYIIDESNLDPNVFEMFERYSEILPSNVSIVIYSNEYLEHTMKDIWMFLNR